MEGVSLAEAYLGVRYKNRCDGKVRDGRGRVDVIRLLLRVECSFPISILTNITSHIVKSIISLVFNCYNFK